MMSLVPKGHQRARPLRVRRRPCEQMVAAGRSRDKASERNVPCQRLDLNFPASVCEQ